MQEHTMAIALVLPNDAMDWLISVGVEEHVSCHVDIVMPQVDDGRIVSKEVSKVRFIGEDGIKILDKHVELSVTFEGIILYHKLGEVLYACMFIELMD